MNQTQTKSKFYYALFIVSQFPALCLSIWQGIDVFLVFVLFWLVMPLVLLGYCIWYQVTYGKVHPMLVDKAKRDENVD